MFSSKNTLELFSKTMFWRILTIGLLTALSLQTSFAQTATKTAKKAEEEKKEEQNKPRPYFRNDGRRGILNPRLISSFNVTNSGGSSLFYVQDDGNVGIGTTTPGDALHVFTNTSYGGVLVEGGTSSGGINGIMIKNDAGYQYNIGVGGSLSGSIPNMLSFYDNNAGAIRMLIDNTGKVGIGTTSPNEQLEIAGNLRLPSTGIIFFGANRFIHNFGATNNFFAGIDAGNLTMSGNNNTGVGYYTLSANTTGHSNTATGRTALASTASGYSNTAAGRSALFSNTSGFENTAFGRNALLTNDTGSGNTAIGYLADVGSGNLTNATAIGANALVSSSNSLVLGGTGVNAVNVGIGTTSPASKLEVAGTIHSTGGGFKFPDGTTQTTAGTGSQWNSSGSDIYYNSGNVGIGDATPTHTLEVGGRIGINDIQVLNLPNQTNFTGSLFLGNGGGSLSHTTGAQGFYNTAVGIDALNAVTTGHSNTASGHQALYSNTTGMKNTASGRVALYNNTTGSWNTASGKDGLFTNTTGSQNTANGNQALYNNTTANNNTASGHQALYSNTTGGLNTAIGVGALWNNTTGNMNTASGVNALPWNTSGENNTASGYEALYNNTTGDYNVGMGRGANYYNQSGSKNTIIGYAAGMGTGLHSPSGNVFLGYYAGFYETGSNKLYIENSGSSTPLIGGDFSTNEVYLNGKVGIGTSSPVGKLDIDNGETGYRSHFYYTDGNTYIRPSSTGNVIMDKGNVGIGTTEPTFPLQVNSTGLLAQKVRVDRSSTSTSSSQALIVQSYNTATGSSQTLGITSYASSASGINAGTVYGVSGTAAGNSIGTKIGVYGNVGGNGIKWAVYANGDVYTTGQYLPSDRKFKKDIRKLSNVLPELMQLEAKTYQYKTDDPQYKHLNLPDKKQYGFIAQDVEKFFPELVKDVIHPAEVDEDGNAMGGEINAKSLNYTGLIPLLLQAIQELQERVVELEKQN